MPLSAQAPRTLDRAARGARGLCGLLPATGCTDPNSPIGRAGWRRPLAVLALLGLVAASSGAQAQSLQVLYGVARGYDATFLAARLQADAAGHKVSQAEALKRPTVNATAGVTANRSETPWSTVTQTNTLQGTVGVSAQYTIYNRSNDKTIAQAQLGLAVAQAQLQGAEHELAMRVTQAYFDVLAAADALATVRVSKQAIAEQVASAKKNFEVGTVTITDTREAEARFDLARAQELAAENDLNTARVALEQLVGRQNLTPRPLAKPASLPALEPGDVEAWVRLADENNPALKQLRLARELARLETEKAQAAGSPTVALTAALQLVQNRTEGRSKASDGSSLAYGPNSGLGPNASVGVQVAMPLYTGGAVQQRVKETVVLEQKSEAELEAARRTVGQTTRIAFYSVRSLIARVAALEAAESSSALALEATQLGYQVGVRVNLDVLNAQTQLFQAQRDLARARYDVLVNLLKLKQAAGVLQHRDLAAVSTLLSS